MDPYPKEPYCCVAEGCRLARQGRPSMRSSTLRNILRTIHPMTDKGSSPGAIHVRVGSSRTDHPARRLQPRAPSAGIHNHAAAPRRALDAMLRTHQQPIALQIVSHDRLACSEPLSIRRQGLLSTLRPDPTLIPARHRQTEGRCDANYKAARASDGVDVILQGAIVTPFIQFSACAGPSTAQQLHE